MSETNVTPSQALTLMVAGDEYAIGILSVKEIIEYEQPTRVPSAPPCVEGVINLRGSVVPVVNLAARFGVPATPVTTRTCIVIVEIERDGETTVMGVTADRVNEVIDLAPSDVSKPPDFGTRVRAEYLVGMVTSGRKFILLLDVDRLLSSLDVELPPSDVPFSQPDNDLMQREENS